MFKDLVQNSRLSKGSFLVVLGVLGQKMFNNLNPVLEEDFYANLVGVDVVAPKSLHSEIINEAIPLHYFHLLSNLRVFNFTWDESESD